ncbi:hypothetical protein [Streptomyces paromomycinus]|uniref:hypothetical protein n=1 Tax=Streptomyces paromomycinus TaxID=92743 RepID=UPI001478B768|nr:hypothetical protein [Streptomyces paromomycinus]
MPRPVAVNGRRSARPAARHTRPAPPLPRSGRVDAVETRALLEPRGPVEIREALAIRGARAAFAVPGLGIRDARDIRGSLGFFDARPAATQQYCPNSPGTWLFPGPVAPERRATGRCR